MADLFHSAKLRLSRGQEHIVDLDKRIRSFLQEKPYTIIRDPNLHGVQELEKVTIKFTKPIPDIFAAVAADAVDNLRSALDNAWYAIAVASEAISDTDEASFPIFNNVAGLNRFDNGWSDRFPKEILTLLRSFQPYKGENGFIWTLNRICVKNKHRVVAPIHIISSLSAYHSTPFGETKEKRLHFNGREDTTNNEIVFTVLKSDARIEYNIDFAFHVNFDEITLAYGHPMIDILNTFAGIVQHIVETLERTARVLGYI